MKRKLRILQRSSLEDPLAIDAVGKSSVVSVSQQLRTVVTLANVASKPESGV
jgi:hypothetical protein